MLLYIHGFNSSPLSNKAVLTAEYIRQQFPQLEFYQPQLPSSPQQAMSMLIDITEQAKAVGKPLRFIGSSLGGYFASYLAEKYSGKAVLVNPAVKPFDLFEEFIGPQYNPYTDEHYQVLPAHRDDVAQYNTEVICHPDRFFVMLQTGDEVLDYRQALHKYHCCEMLLEPQGDHSFVGYELHLARISQFLKLGE
ncbi:YqiA/YcfP family alpha/beta fold hydrolase [Shewanella intestini]|uniref:Esterase YqiA n=1 Tax=Shewanella intestini TaxID=2017544 RepID=A0ABS5I0W8_9GAMM|nr:MULTISPECIES: YqiA/YcfP family alpha/beta fold hydrolase [Shewanella]MBR9727669.1 esterase YqiA [Shewanella intestini]MRG35181.1 esterase YqiA [Shewanella sp. XMDDZSB0408]